MKLTLSTWAQRNFEKKYTLPTLRMWAINGQISPEPVKIAGTWHVEHDAVYVPKLREYEKPDGGMSDRCLAIIGR
jgi:hypothetical protein